VAPLIFIDVGGRGPGLVPPEKALLPYNDRGFLYGDGLFETLLLTEGRIPLLPLHLLRLETSAAQLGIPFNAARARAGVAAVADTCSPTGEYAMRLTLTRGPAEQRSYQPPQEPTPTLVIAAHAYRRPGGPLSAVTAPWRVNADSTLAKHKTLSALEKVLARAHASTAGCDEALLLNTAGRVAEGAASNLFAVKKGLWLTPALSEGCLPGVMRRRVIDLTHAVEWRLTPEDLYQADAVYLTNALMGCLPLAALDGRGLPWAERPACWDQLFKPAQ
jgi:branched-chain amino acid aminotransferase